MLGSIKVHAGDFGKCSAHFMLGSLVVEKEVIKPSEIEEVSIATEETVKRIGGAVGWGIAGGLLLGPAGLLAGLLLGGKSKEATFVLKLRDGRKILGTTDSETYTKLMAATFAKK